jgi:preprotein translocase subunit SecY
MANQDNTQKTDEAAREQLDRYLALAAVTLLAVGTVVYHLIEDWSWVDSFYFSVIAVTTVGFGDITPDTDGAKLFTVFYVITGITIIATWLNERLRKHGLRAQHRRRGRSAD